MSAPPIGTDCFSLLKRWASLTNIIRRRSTGCIFVSPPIPVFDEMAARWSADKPLMVLANLFGEHANFISS
jgi:hypothetical protein